MALESVATILERTVVSLFKSGMGWPCKTRH
jgi:hypothetical protein